MTLYHKYKSSFYYERKRNEAGLTQDENETLEKLSKDKSIIICKADKGNSVVVLDRNDYIRKMNNILLDKSKFKKVSKDSNLDDLVKFQRFLYNLKRKKSLDEAVYTRIRPSAATTPTSYGLPKVHKLDTPCRPILAATGSYTYECSSWLNEILIPLRDHPANLKDGIQFVNEISKLSINQSDQLASFDVKSLFTNIPIEFVINLILEKIYDENHIDKFYGMKKTQFKKLLNWVTKKTVLQFNDSYFEQIDGIAMGIPLTPLMAGVCMNWLISQTSEFKCQPKTFFRYVDDCFAIFSEKSEIVSFFNKLNQIHPQIQFTAEYEIENQLPFLDVLVEKGTNNNLQLSVYRKPTHTGLYINWLSFVPYRYKLNLIKCLLDKAFKICSNRPLMQKEFDFISTLLGKNGYPKRLIEIQTRKFLREKEKVVETTTRTKEQAKCVFFRLPYIGNVSNQIQKEIR